jgi:hypothetical protein
VGFDSHRHVSVSWRTAIRAIFALSSKDEIIAIVNTCGHFHLKPHAPFLESIASTCPAWLLRYFSSAIATVAGNDYLPEARDSFVLDSS